MSVVAGSVSKKGRGGASCRRCVRRERGREGGEGPQVLGCPHIARRPRLGGCLGPQLEEVAEVERDRESVALRFRDQSIRSEFKFRFHPYRTSHATPLPATLLI